MLLQVVRVAVTVPRLEKLRAEAATATARDARVEEVATPVARPAAAAPPPPPMPSPEAPTPSPRTAYHLDRVCVKKRSALADLTSGHVLLD